MKISVSYRKQNFPLTHFPWGLPTRAQPHNNSTQEREKRKRGKLLLVEDDDDEKQQQKIFPSFSAFFLILIFLFFRGTYLTSNIEKVIPHSGLPCVIRWSTQRCEMKEKSITKMVRTKNVWFFFYGKNLHTDEYMQRAAKECGTVWEKVSSSSSSFFFRGWETNERIEEDMAMELSLISQPPFSMSSRGLMTTI